MLLTKVFVVLLFAAVCFERGADGFSFSTVIDIFNVAQETIVTLAKTWDLVDQSIDFSDVPVQFLRRTENKMFSKIDRVNSQLDNLAEKVEEIGSRSFSNIMNNLHEGLRLELRLNDLLDYRERIDVNYKRMSKYVSKQKYYEPETLLDFANSVVSHDPNSVINLLERINGFVIPEDTGITNTGILKTLSDNLHEIEGELGCSAKQSPQQVLANLYDAIAMTELKGYTMIQFSYMLLKLNGRGNFTEESLQSRDRFKERTKQAAEVVRNAMKEVRRDLWNCDPKKHVLGETYEQITNLLQGYIQNEVDLNSQGTCSENCAAYTYTKSHGCFSNLYCRQQRNCGGKIVNCRFFDSDMWICNANPLSGRRYEYIEYENGRVLGRKQGCAKGTTKVDSWWRWLFWHCSYCFCLCDEQGPMSDRYVNMRAAISDIENNKVVTGLRFVKKNRIIHLQIQEGELLPRMAINDSTVTWKPVEGYKITDKHIYNRQDYHTFTWEKKALDLDDLEAEDGHVVTGVRFKEIGFHLNFEIYTTKFDFATGKLKSEISMWIDNPNTDIALKKPRTVVRLTKPDIPIRTTAPSIPTSKSDQYLEFTHTDIDRDAAQTTVPYFDAQKLESRQPVPLSGAGIFHKGRPYFGGFITPKIITLDVTKYINAPFPEENSVEVN